MSVVLIVLAVFFGLVVWCTGIRLCRMLLAAVRSRRTAAIRVSQDVISFHQTGARWCALFGPGQCGLGP